MLMPLVPLFFPDLYQNCKKYSVMARTSCSLGK
jgi:hypothetical protein